MTKPAVAPETKTHHVGEITCDEALFERLRDLRKKLADERDVPAYIIFSDVALRQMARNYPKSESDFARISGVGEKKLREFGEVFLNEIALHLATNPRQIFAEESFVAPQSIRKTSLNDTTRETFAVFARVNPSNKLPPRADLPPAQFTDTLPPQLKPEKTLT